MDGGDQLATIHGVAKSGTHLTMGVRAHTDTHTQVPLVSFSVKRVGVKSQWRNKCNYFFFLFFGSEHM